MKAMKAIKAMETFSSIVHTARARRTLILRAGILLLFLSAASTVPMLPRPALAIRVDDPSGALPRIGNCDVFPADNPWNTDISDLPAHPDSAAFINTMLGDDNQHLHADFGSNPEYGIPFVVVPANQPVVPIEFVEYGDESDPGPYPIPPDAPVEAGSDHHVLVVDGDNCMLYELYRAEYVGPGWQASSGAVFDLTTNAVRPEGWTSADAAGLPIFPGLARYDEIEMGEINHALRFTARHTRRAYIFPARHFASSDTDPDLPPMGLRLRLRADYDISGYNGHARVILEALKRYGMILADNGADWFISGATDSRWHDEDLDQLKTVPGSAFEAVDTGPIVTEDEE